MPNFGHGVSKILLDTKPPADEDQLMVDMSTNPDMQASLAEATTVGCKKIAFDTGKFSHNNFLNCTGKLPDKTLLKSTIINKIQNQFVKILKRKFFILRKL